MSIERFLPPKPTKQFISEEVHQLVSDISDGIPLAQARFDAVLCDSIPGPIMINDVREVLATEYRFESWAQLTDHIENIEQIEDEVEKLRTAFARASTEEERRTIIDGHHSKKRFVNLDPTADSLCDHDARVLIANKRGFAHWIKLHAYIHLIPEVRHLIQSIEENNITSFFDILGKYPHAVNPRWVHGFASLDEHFPNSINDCIPLFRLSRAVSDGRISAGTVEYQMAEALIETGADINYDSGHPLKAAISFGSIKVVKALLQSGASPDGHNGGREPIALAARFGTAEILQILVTHGATLDLKSAAAVGDLGQLRKCLKETHPLIEDLSQAFYFAIKFSHFRCADLLLDNGVDIDGMVLGLQPVGSALHWSVFKPEHLEEHVVISRVGYLLDHGANANVLDPPGAPPISWTNSDAVKTLLAKTSMD